MCKSHLDLFIRLVSLSIFGAVFTRQTVELTHSITHYRSGARDLHILASTSNDCVHTAGSVDVVHGMSTKVLGLVSTNAVTVNTKNFSLRLEWCVCVPSENYETLFARSA